MMINTKESEILGWLNKQESLYQPIKGYENKISVDRVAGFYKTLNSIIGYCGEVKGKRILEIGPNAGWYAFRLADLGARVTAVEMDGRMFKICRYVAERDGYTGNPEFINADAKNWVENTSERFDYVLLLNVFHHILSQNEETGWRMFNKLMAISNGVFVSMRTKIKEGYHLCGNVREIPHVITRRSTAARFEVVGSCFERTLYVFKNNSSGRGDDKRPQ